jgi:hypothetical protein
MNAGLIIESSHNVRMNFTKRVVAMRAATSSIGSRLSETSPCDSTLHGDEAESTLSPPYPTGRGFLHEQRSDWTRYEEQEFH